MTHLEERVTALVDGRLTPDATERALVHLAECARCRVAVAAERATRRALREAPDPVPSSELLSRLLAMGGPAGPLAPRPGHVPGAPRPVPLPPPGAPWQTRPPGRTDGVRSGRRRRRTLRSAALGVVSVASLGLVGLLLIGTVASRQAPEPVAFGAASLAPGVQPAAGAPAGTVDRLDDEELAALRADGWPCPESLAGGLPLVEAHSIDTGDVPVLHLRYSDGRATVSVVEQRGELDPGQATAFSQAISAGTAGRRDVPWHAIWQSGDVVVAVVAEGPPHVLSSAVEALPSADPVDDRDGGWWDRVGRGADVVAALLSGS
ncbi:MAG: zf-HC2 domain-containing protein [Actinomycetota bacterium]